MTAPLVLRPALDDPRPVTVTAVLGDAEFGDSATLRRFLHRAHVPYALGVSSDFTAFLGTPVLVPPPPLTGTGRPRTRHRLSPEVQTIEARAWAAAQPARAWRLVSRRNGTNPPWRARFCAVRVTPAHDWRERRRAPEVWLLCERDLGATRRTKCFLVHLPADVSVRTLVRLAHQRWAIEQPYQELKDEIGLDHFEGRSFPGWNRHVVLTARVQLPAAGTPAAWADAPHAAPSAGGDSRGADGASVHHPAGLLAVDARTQGCRTPHLTNLTE